MAGTELDQGGDGQEAAASGYQPSGAPDGKRTLKREATTVKTVEEMRLSELLKLSDALGRIQVLDLGTVLVSAGVGLGGAAIGAAATGETLFSGVPLFCLLVGAAALVLGLAISRERGEAISGIRKNLDFDIDGWCQDDHDAAAMRDRYRQAMKTLTPLERVRRLRDRSRGGDDGDA